jgi:hypothetical protein
MQQNNNPATGENNEWLPIDLENLPSHQLICEWKHPEYGIVIGNIVKYGGRLESEQSLWIFPVGGLDADIALSEFTHYRKIKRAQPLPVVADREGEKPSLNTYNVCHDCQSQGLRNCAYFDECGRIKTYPIALRKMVEADYGKGVKLSITAEKAYDMAIAAERFRIVGIIEEATTGYQDELDRDILSSIGVKNNEVRIKELNRLKSLIQPLPTLSTI